MLQRLAHPRYKCNIHYRNLQILFFISETLLVHFGGLIFQLYNGNNCILSNQLSQYNNERLKKAQSFRYQEIPLYHNSISSINMDSNMMFRKKKDKPRSF